jgi:hypothetical protein
MWNMVMNLPSKDGHGQQPFYDDTGATRKFLVDGKPYGNEDLSAERGHFMSGKTPYEASSMYSKELKDIIRMCLRYRQQDRPSVEKLRELVQKYAAKELRTKAKGELLLKIPGAIQELRVGMTRSPRS